MIEVKLTNVNHINGIIKVCSEGYRDTYKDTHTNEYIERIIGDFLIMKEWKKKSYILMIVGMAIAT